MTSSAEVIERNLDKCYNEYYADKAEQQIKRQEINEEMILEGRLRIHWGLRHPIHFKQKDDSVTTPVIKSLQPPDFLQEVSFDEGSSFPNGGSTPHPCDSLSSSLTLPHPGWGERTGPRGAESSMYGSVVLRGERRAGRGGEKTRRRVRKRQSILNGHVYNAETSMFVPTYGSVTSVTVTSLDTTPQVVKQLLDKFKIENIPECYCLCIVKISGVTQRLRDEELPLIERLVQGPNEEEAKLFIMEKNSVSEISQEVAQYINLPETMLHGFLKKLEKDEEFELGLLKERHKNFQSRINERISLLSSPS